MGKFNEYSQKATPADNDTLMIYDATSKSNKLSPFSGIWNWIVEKLTNAVISNLQTSNQTVLGAINELNNGLPAGGIYDLDNPPKKMIFSAMVGSTNLPNDFGGANAVTVIQMNLGGGNFDAMIAFTFAVDKIAIRRKNGTKNWSKWEYFNTAEILSNLTTTNKNSLVGAINELNSNRVAVYIGKITTSKTGEIATNNFISGSSIKNIIAVKIFDSAGSRNIHTELYSYKTYAFFVAKNDAGDRLVNTELDIVVFYIK